MSHEFERTREYDADDVQYYKCKNCNSYLFYLKGRDEFIYSSLNAIYGAAYTEELSCKDAIIREIIE